MQNFWVPQPLAHVVASMRDGIEGKLMLRKYVRCTCSQRSQCFSFQQDSFHRWKRWLRGWQLQAPLKPHTSSPAQLRAVCLVSCAAAPCPWHVSCKRTHAPRCALIPVEPGFQLSVRCHLLLLVSTVASEVGLAAHELYLPQDQSY